MFRVGNARYWKMNALAMHVSSGNCSLWEEECISNACFEWGMLISAQPHATFCVGAVQIVTAQLTAAEVQSEASRQKISGEERFPVQ